MQNIGNLAIAAMMLFMAWRMWPAAKHWMENGPKGNSKEWLTAAMLLGGVMLFVWILIKAV